MKHLVWIFIFLIGCAGSIKNFDLQGDFMNKFFINMEVKNNGEDGIRFYRTQHEHSKYVKCYYDLNKDGKADMIQYHILMSSTWEIDLDIGSDDKEWRWEARWFRKELDRNFDGKFDEFLVENEEGKILVYYNKPSV